MRIELVYCTAHKQTSLELEVSSTCTAHEAIDQSKILERLHLNFDSLTMGIFGQHCPLDTMLKTGDRVELYRPLLLTPTEARRLRATTQANKPK